MKMKTLFAAILFSLLGFKANSQPIYDVPDIVHETAKAFTEAFYSGDYEKCLNDFKLNRKEFGYILQNVKSTITTCQDEGFCTKIKDFKFEPLKSTLEQLAENVEMYDVYFKRSEEYYTSITLLHKDGEVEIGFVDGVAESSKLRISDLK